MRKLYEFDGMELLKHLESAQEAVREAEVEHARAKARFEATAAVLAEDRRREEDKPLAANVPHLIKRESAWQDAHEVYLKALVDYQSAKDARQRASDALSLWQTERADVRKV